MRAQAVKPSTEDHSQHKYITQSFYSFLGESGKIDGIAKPFPSHFLFLASLYTGKRLLGHHELLQPSWTLKAWPGPECGE